MDVEDTEFGKRYFFVVTCFEYHYQLQAFETKKEAEKYMLGKDIICVWRGVRLNFKKVKVVEKYKIKGC